MLQLNSLLYWGQKERKKVTFCFMETQYLFISSEVLPDYRCLFLLPLLRWNDFHRGRGFSDLIDCSHDRVHSPFEWTHPSRLRSLFFKLQWLNLAGTKILVLHLCISQCIPYEQWDGFPKWLPQCGTVKIHWVFKESLRIEIKYFSIFFTLWAVWKGLSSYDFIYSRWHRFISF